MMGCERRAPGREVMRLGGRGGALGGMMAARADAVDASDASAGGARGVSAVAEGATRARRRAERGIGNATLARLALRAPRSDALPRNLKDLFRSHECLAPGGYTSVVSKRAVATCVATQPCQRDEDFARVRYCLALSRRELAGQRLP